MASYTQKDVETATQELISHRRLKGGFKPLTPETSAFRVKSVELTSDKRLKEMEHFLQSHTYLARITQRASEGQGHTFITEDAEDGFESTPHIVDPRSAGIDKLNQELRKLAKKSMRSPRRVGHSIVAAAGQAGPNIAAASGQSSVESPRKVAADLALESRVQWRQGLDKNLRLMLDDLNLSRNSTLDNGGYQMVCEQFDKTYDWFSSSGGKSARKERETAPFLNFDPGRDPMPGSTRGLPKR